MKEKLVYKFPSSSAPEISEVGGKGLSLIKGSKKKLPVPPGFILTVSFFAPWIADIKRSDVWNLFIDSVETKQLKLCKEIKDFALKLSFSQLQLSTLSEMTCKSPPDSIFAVRSSSPEEDLEGSSFAGIYETELGITNNNLQQSIRQVFASCLDPRIYAYKKENNFDICDPKIAVIIQQQIPSEISGVGFSLNPFTNNYDEVVINSNWGLGESVVSGVITPDTYIIDRIGYKIKSKITGSKEQSIWLNDEGGTFEKQNFKSSQNTLDNEKAKLITELITEVENIYNKPMDIEWAFYKEKLYLLQARPITTYFPLPEEMQTISCKRKVLYQDMTISVQGLYKPLSAAGTSIYISFFDHLCRYIFFKKPHLSPKNSLLWITAGRMYANLSNLFSFVGKNNAVNFIQNMDPLSAKIIINIDENIYKRTKSHKLKFKLTVLHIVFKAAPYLLRGLLFPAYTDKLNHRKFKAFEKYAKKLSERDLPIDIFTDKLLKKLVVLIFKHGAPLALSARGLLRCIKKFIPDAQETDLESLELALPNNVTTKMGMELYKLSTFIPAKMDKKQFFQKLTDNSLPSELKEAWNKFLNAYGHRCPDELEPASPRYRDNPQPLVDMVFSVRTSEGEPSPVNNFKKLETKRKKAFDNIYKLASKNRLFKAKLVKFIYRYIETFAGYRETHKYYAIYAVDLIRQKIQQIGKDLYKADRLDSAEQAFELNLNELSRCTINNDIDARAIVLKNTALTDRFRKYPKLPTIFDSRGLILRAPARKAKPGEIPGTSVSAGVAKGPVKVMHTPTEKPFNKGDILVARATDPAWTTLFVNASAVILEVGGALQHGALVAREYGLPCVTGIENATSLWSDGEMVEVDGDSGIIRKVPPRSL
ncbi:MAG: hypothetical protein GY750_15215 [Lentisphaerae bacterium]|nr:hypothetical protein [Lentisphaerota bacterium]MCP4102747.1 hypothetical protein [Lentisphaerota bacterium]